MSNPRLAAASRRRSGAVVALERVGEAFTAVGRFLARDLIATLLLCASIGLAVTFFVLLGSLGQDASGTQVSLSTVNDLASAQRIRSATLLDRDHQVEAVTETGLRIFAD
jgi:cell division protease FtsH